ncbi:TIGR03943 family protein [Vagococcus sp. PNs007]|uniref:TIGR03943 family protein n=1 Tax=Vagococcus proximus TaxID=2991417 RepID=A0ABT5X4C9_9ENTE|nr:TIGR03943 family protein [Vagococcus proximus]MDF0480850.1 TIGR03943 family protein [Vagococcus proximus]
MIRTWILAGYFMMMSYLQTSGKINQYINPKYQYLSKMTMFFALFLAIIQLIRWVREDTSKESCDCEDGHNHGSKTWFGKASTYFLVSLPVLVVFLLPTVNLDASIIDAKGFNFPISKDSTSFGDIEQQYLKPNTHIFFNDKDYDELMEKDLSHYKDKKEIYLTDKNYLEVMELIYNYPKEFNGKKVKLTGFAYNQEQTKKIFLFRFGILHCVADSGVYGLMLQTDNPEKKWDDNTWLQVTGIIDTEFYEPFGQVLPVVKVDKTLQIDAPKDEYVYRIF